MQYFDNGDCTKMIMKIAKIEFEATNQSFFIFRKYIFDSMYSNWNIIVDTNFTNP